MLFRHPESYKLNPDDFFLQQWSHRIDRLMNEQSQVICTCLVNDSDIFCMYNFWEPGT